MPGTVRRIMPVMAMWMLRSVARTSRRLQPLPDCAHFCAFAVGNLRPRGRQPQARPLELFFPGGPAYRQMKRDDPAPQRVCMQSITTTEALARFGEDAKTHPYVTIDACSTG